MDASGETASDSLLGRTIAGKFRIDAIVGRGSMGAVYRATHLALNKKVAIKVMNKHHPADSAFAARFKREAKAASRLDHPNSLRVIDVGGDEDGLLYIAMEYVEGRDLLQVLRSEFPLTKERCVSILSQTLAALAVAHEMGVIHRDLKPENILLVRGKDDEGEPAELVKVCDFGIAKILEVPKTDDTSGGRTTGTLTARGMLIGTPEYMSPEQARGEPADARSDIYSLGVILFQLLTGRLPFSAASKIRLVLKHVEEAPPSPLEIDSKIDLRLEAICMKALQKRPEDRFQSAREMRAMFRDIIGRDSIQTRAYSSRPKIAANPPSVPEAPASPPPMVASLPPSDSESSSADFNATETSIRGTAQAEARAMHPTDSDAHERFPKTYSTETPDPLETADALAEVRKLLSERPVSSSSHPIAPTASPSTRSPVSPQSAPAPATATLAKLEAESAQDRQDRQDRQSLRTTTTNKANSTEPEGPRLSWNANFVFIAFVVAMVVLLFALQSR